MNSTPAAKLRSRKSAFHEGFVGGKGVHEEQVERSAGDDRFDDDFAGAKPIEFLTTIQGNLQGADRDAQYCEAEPVQLLDLITGCLGQESHHAHDCQQTDGHVDVEHVTPTVARGQPAAEHGTEDWACHHGHAPEGHRGSMTLTRINRQQYGLRKRDERSPKYALQNAKEHDLEERLRRTTQDGGEREPGDRGQEQAFESEPAG
jgi:hypothetical protein